MKLFFAGTESKTYISKVQENGVQRILQSAFYLNYKHAPNAIAAPDYLLDSGGFTAIKKGTPISVEKFTDYINKFEVKVAFNMDVLDTAETLRNQKHLEKHTKAYIIPVYHHHEFRDAKWKDLIVQFAKEYPFISLGGNPTGIGLDEKMRYMDFVYSNVGLKSKVHGLGVTNHELLQRYPWFSVDSTTWLAASQFGTFINFNEGKMSKTVSVRARNKLSCYKQLTSMDHKLNEAIKAFIKMEKHITQLWANRGVIWDEKPFR